MFTASYSGFVNGDTASSLGTAVTLGTTALASSPVGAYIITASGAAYTNYDISYGTGTLTIDPAALTITANNTNKVYGATLPVFTANYSGFVNGDTASSLTTPVTLATTATVSSPVGNYTITASGAAYTNYNIGFVNGTLTVGTALLTVTADNKSKAYGQALPELTASYSGFVNNDDTNSLTALATLATTATSVSNVGVYPITASGATSTNYSFAYAGGLLTITNSLTSGAVASSANPALPADNVTFTMTASAVAPGAGTPTGTVNFRIDGSIAGSGALSGGLATFTINSLSHGSHTVSAEYAGDLNFAGTTNTLAVDQVINTPPVAGNDTITRNPLLSTKVRLSTLLASDSDADGDTLNITVSSTSASNATVTVSGGWVFYTPPAGFTNADSFTYTITDGRGGSAVGIVTVAILVDNSQSQNLTITDLGGGAFSINGSGIPGYTYRLQYSDSASPFIWQEPGQRDGGQHWRVPIHGYVRRAHAVLPHRLSVSADKNQKRGFVRSHDRRSPVLHKLIKLLAGFDRPINQHKPRRMNHSIFTTIKLPGLGIFSPCGPRWCRRKRRLTTFRFPANVAVPDGNVNGLALVTNLTGLNGIITNLTLSLDIRGGYNGDLYAYLRGPNGGFAVLLNRTGVTAGNAFGYSDTGFNVTFDDSANNNDVHFYQSFTYNLNGGDQLTGNWSSDGRAIDPFPVRRSMTQPSRRRYLTSFDGTDPNGIWTFFLADLSNGGQSTIVNWGLNITTVPEPATYALLGIGLALFRARRRLRG